MAKKPLKITIFEDFNSRLDKQLFRHCESKHAYRTNGFDTAYMIKAYNLTRPGEESLPMWTSRYLYKITQEDLSTDEKKNLAELV